MSVKPYKTTEAARNADVKDLRKRLGGSTDPREQAVLGCALYASGKRGAISDSIPLLQAGESIGDTVSRLFLADAYLQGKGVQKDIHRALDMFLDLAMCGNAEAQFAYGNIYYLGDGVPKDYEKAYEFISSAAAQNDPRALNTLGLFYLGGLCVPRDVEKAERYFKRAEERGNKNGTRNLKLLDKYGRDYDFSKVVRRSAEAGPPYDERRYDVHYDPEEQVQYGPGTVMNEQKLSLALGRHGFVSVGIACERTFGVVEVAYEHAVAETAEIQGFLVRTDDALDPVAFLYWDVDGRPREHHRDLRTVPHYAEAVVSAEMAVDGDGHPLPAPIGADDRVPLLEARGE